MNHYVADANVLFSAFISGKQQYISFFDRNRVVTIDFVFIELEKYRTVILKKSKLSQQELFDFSIHLFQKVTVVPSFTLSAEIVEEAYNWCEDIDPKDVLYVALTLQHVGSKLITRDSILHNGLKAKGFDNVVMFHEVFGT